MMFAMRLERNVAQQHDLVIAADLFEGARQMDRGILVIALAILLPRARDAARGVEQAFARRTVACPLDQRAHGVGDMVGHDHLAVWSQFTLVVAHRPAFTVAIMSHISACQSGLARPRQEEFMAAGQVYVAESWLFEDWERRGFASFFGPNKSLDAFVNSAHP